MERGEIGPRRLEDLMDDGTWTYRDLADVVQRHGIQVEVEALEGRTSLRIVDSDNEPFRPPYRAPSAVRASADLLRTDPHVGTERRRRALA